MGSNNQSLQSKFMVKVLKIVLKIFLIDTYKPSCKYLYQLKIPES